MSASKIVFLKLLPQSIDIAASRHPFACELLQSSASEKTAVVLHRTKDDFLTIQGYPPVPYKEKHRSWLLFRTAVKNLLGIAEATSICIRFADSPFATVSDVTAVLQEPNHIVNLIVSVLPRPTNSTAEHEVSLKLAKEPDTCDPYCKYRRLYPTKRSVNNDSTRESGLVRTKCNFAEMNRLLSQLADVSLSLQRTQHECDEIAKRCRQKEQMRSSSTSLLSKKGSKRIDPNQEQHDGAVSLQGLATADVVDDTNVEKLLSLAESLTQRIIHQQKKSSANGTGAISFLPARYQPMDTGVVLPDCPSDVCVRANFSEGAYVMWNPVSLDAWDENHGHRVRGYVIFMNSHPIGRVEGALTSHAEIQGMEGGVEYQVQVGTLAELCNSALSLPVAYRHVSPRRSPHSALFRSKSQPIASYHKAAKVESWLKMNSNARGGDAVSMSALGDIHLRSNRTTGSLNTNDGSHLAEGSIHVLTRPAVTTTTNMTNVTGDGEDARSISSSHTSGIVTDLPASPKLSPACSCKQCTSYTTDSSTHSPSHHSPSHHSPSHHHQHPPPRDRTSTQVCSSSTLSINNTIDTVIDEPLVFHSSRPSPLLLPPTTLMAAANHKGPLPPQNVRVKAQFSGSITVLWTPVRRDLRGCSNGYYVLGYRIYLNGSSHVSVDGPVTFEASLKCPTEAADNRLLIHVRTRSISGESLPSNTFVYDLLMHQMVEQPRRTKFDSVLSSTDSASFCRTESLHSHHIVGTASSDCPIRTDPRIETYV